MAFSKKYELYENVTLDEGLAWEISGVAYIRVYDATDAGTYIQIQGGDKANKKYKMYDREAVKLDKDDMLYITSPAQVGKTISILTAVDFETFRVFDSISFADIDTIAAVTLVSTITTLSNLTNITNPVTVKNENLITNQITKSALESGGASTILHTVTAGKKLLLSKVSFQTSAGAYAGDIHVRNVADAIQYRIFRQDVNMSAVKIQSASFSPALIIPEGFDIVITSSNAGLSITAFIHGMEVNA